MGVAEDPIDVKKKLGTEEGVKYYERYLGGGKGDKAYAGDEWNLNRVVMHLTYAALITAFVVFGCKFFIS